MDYLHWIRGKVGTRKIILAFSSVILRDGHGRVLLQRRTDFDVWGLPGGILEPGENILDCAHRELFEETGLRAGELELVGVYTDPRYDSVYPNGDQVQQYTVCLQGRISGGEMHPDGIETSAQEFFAPGTIPFDQLPIFYRDMLNDSMHGGEPAYHPPYTNPNPVNPVEFLRPLIGKDLYIGVGAHAAVRDHHGRLLMVKRSQDGYWSLPGGFMQMGENVAHAAVRETLEETGLNVALERILGVMSPIIPWVYPNGDRTQTLVTVFLARPLGGILQPDQVETSQVAWMTLDEMLALDTHPTLARLNQAAIAHLDEGAFVI